MQNETKQGTQCTGCFGVLIREWIKKKVLLFKVFCLVDEPMKPLNNDKLLFTPTTQSSDKQQTNINS